MKLCLPVTDPAAAVPVVHGHFGSAPGFLVVETETQGPTWLANQNLDHEHGHCNPVAALAGVRPDAVIVGGLGQGALNGLRQAGIRVFKVPAGLSCAEAVRQFQSGQAEELVLAATCSGHAHGGGACHGHH